MPGIDELPADQRAVLQLLLRRRRSYADIATALRLDDDAVRRRAHAALHALGPGTTATSERRAAAADWLLGQRDDAPAGLAGDEDLRGWASAVRERLVPWAGHDLPELPEAPARATEPDAATPVDPDAAASTLAARAAASAAPISTPAAAAAAASAEEQADGAPSTASPARPRSSRRGGAVLLGALALLAVVAVVVVLLTRGGDDSQGAADPTTTQGTATTTNQNGTRVLAQVNLRPPEGAPDRKAIGVVQIALVNGHQSLVAVAQGLKVTKGSSWGIWAEGGSGGRRWLGPFSQGDAQGRVYAQGRLEPDMDILRYKRLVVSRDAAKTPPKTQGTPYLAGTITAPKQG